MKKKIVPFFLFFLLVTPAYASSTNVNIINNVKSSNSTSTDTESETHIRVETNGKVTEYNSDEPEDVEVKSINGESTIKVNGQVVTGSPTQGDDNENATPTASASPTIKPTNTPDEDKTENVFEKIMEKLNETFEKIWGVLH